MGKTKLRLSHKIYCKLGEVLETLFSGNHKLFSGVVLFNPLSSVCLPYFMANLMLHACHHRCLYFLSITEKGEVALNFFPDGSYSDCLCDLEQETKIQEHKKSVGDKTGFTRGNSDLDYHFLGMVYVCLISSHSDRSQTGGREEFTATKHLPARIQSF